MTRPEEVWDFWFGELDSFGLADAEHGKMWFVKSERTDEIIRARFAEDVVAAGEGRLDHWAETATGRLALILLLDQMTRNIYRGKAESFARDGKALQLALDGLDRGHDRELPRAARVFMYLPLEHAEDLALQERCVALFDALVEEAPAQIHEQMENYRSYAVAHRDVIARFGRFPHRNAILGRENTPEEADYLAQPGAGF